MPKNPTDNWLGVKHVFSSQTQFCLHVKTFQIWHEQERILFRVLMFTWSMWNSLIWDRSSTITFVLGLKIFILLISTAFAYTKRNRNVFALKQPTYDSSLQDTVYSVWALLCCWKSKVSLSQAIPILLYYTVDGIWRYFQPKYEFQKRTLYLDLTHQSLIESTKVSIKSY